MIISEYPLYKAVNSFGLFLDLIGVACFIYKQRRKVWLESGDKAPFWSQPEEKARKEMTLIIGFFLLIAFGFILQIVSNFIPESIKIGDVVGVI